jgi:hypothetical protein
VDSRAERRYLLFTDDFHMFSNPMPFGSLYGENFINREFDAM